jgi:arylsulfatase A-like enzyme
VLLVTLDTTRADVVGCYEGPQPARTPVLDRIAREGILFEHAYTVVPQTQPAHASMFTGLYPVRHGLRTNGYGALPDSARTLAEAASERGYQTAAIVATPVLGPERGFDQGFVLYDALETDEAGAHGERPASEISDRALAWLDARDRRRPFFLWVHFFDPHAPYAPPGGPRSTRTESYAAEVGEVDSQLGRIVTALEDEGALDDCAVLVVADHGEGFMEHDEPTHGLLAYQSTLRVPMLVRPPGGLSVGQRSDAVVSVVDVYPTLASLMGLPRAEDLDGADLLDEIPRSRGVYFECYEGYLAYGWAPIAGWLDSDGKYIHGPEPEFYSLRDDPHERNNLAHTHPGVGRGLEAIEDVASRSRLPFQAIEHREGRLDLADLGYAGVEGSEGDGLPEPTADEGLPAPSRRVQENVQTILARDLCSVGRVEESLALFKELVAANPENIRALEGLADCYEQLGRPQDAIRPLRRLLRLSPPRSCAQVCKPEILVWLADCLAADGQVDDAIETYAQALDLSADRPEWFDQFLALARAHGYLKVAARYEGRFPAGSAPSPGHLHSWSRTRGHSSLSTGALGG